MPFPRRSTRSLVVQLPSVYSTFSTNKDLSIKIPSPKIDDEKELVPVERSASPSAKQILLGQEGLEVILRTDSGREVITKPLPSLPDSTWTRMSVRRRMLAILCIQLLLVLIVGCSLLSAKPRLQRNSQSLEETVAAAESSSTPSPIPTNTTIKRGTFALYIGDPQQQDSGCLAQNNESAAWSCSPRRILRMNLLPTLEEPDNLFASLEAITVNNSPWYGPVGPNIDPVLLSPTEDTTNPKLGLAYHFRATYNRTIILKGDRIADQGQPLGLPETSFTQVQVGDRPWLCTFKETVIEGYIYISQKSTLGHQNVTFFDGKTMTQTPNLPYSFKLMEERVPSSPQPYCIRMEMLGSGRLVPSTKDGEMSRLKLGEGMSTQRTQEKRQTMSERSCKCQWMYQ